MSYMPAIASLSLGRAWVHQISDKFAAAASAGLPGIEIFHEDLVYLAASYHGGLTDSNQLLAANEIRHLCDSLNLQIIALGPFKDCEGLLDPSARAAKIEELKLWFKMAKILRTDIIQIPCTFMTEGVTGDKEVIVKDLKDIADMGKAEEPVIRFAYENLCFGTYNDTWQKGWDIVKAVDCENFGMCLDTFNIAGREWADPTSASGMVENADAVMRESLKKMAKEIDIRKVFYVQVVDAERLARPLNMTHEFHVDGQKPRMSWSRNCRLFLCEEARGGYLPVLDVLRTICDEETGLGYKGWISMELFNRSLLGKAENVPDDHARRAMESWSKVVRLMGWEEVNDERNSVRNGAIIRNSDFEESVGVEVVAKL